MASDASDAPSLQIQSDGWLGFTGTYARYGKVKLSPGGKLLAVLKSGNIVLFDAQSGRRLRRWNVDKNVMFSDGEICFADGGEHLLYKPERAKSVWLYRTRDGAEVRLYQTNIENLFSNCLDGDGFFRHLSSRRDSEKADSVEFPFFGVYEGKLELQLMGAGDWDAFPIDGGNHFGVIRSIRSDSPRIATKTDIAIYSRNNVTSARWWLQIDADLRGNDIAVSPIAGHLAYFEKDRVVLIDLATRKKTDLSILKDFTHGIKFLNDGRWIIGAKERRGDWIVIDRVTMQVVNRGTGYVDADPTGRVVIVADADDNLIVLPVPSLKMQSKIASLNTPLEEIIVGSGSIFLRGATGLAKKVALTQNGSDADLIIGHGLLAMDKVSGWLAFYQSEGGLKLQGPDGTQLTANLPNNEIPLLMEFMPGKELAMVAINAIAFERIKENRRSSRPDREMWDKTAFRLYFVDRDGVVRKLKDGIGPPRAMHATSTGDMLWMSSEGRLTGYQLPEFKETHAIADTGAISPTAIVSAENGAVIFTRRPGRVDAWDVASSTKIGTFPGGVQSIAVGATNKVYLARGRDIVVWDYRAAPRVIRFPQGTRAMSFRLDRYASQAQEQYTEVEIGALGETANPVVHIPAGTCRVPRLFSRDSKYLLCGPPAEPTADHDFLVVDASTGIVVRRFESWEISPILPGFTPDGMNILARDEDNHIVTINISSGERRRVAPASSVVSLVGISQSADARRIGFLTKFHGIKYFELSGDRWALVAEIPLRTTANSFAISPDGNRIAIATPGRIAVHDAKSGESLRDMRYIEYGGLGVDIRFTGDSRRIIVREENGTVSLFDINNGDLVRKYGGKNLVFGDNIVRQEGSSSMLTVRNLAQRGSSDAGWEILGTATEDLFTVSELPNGFVAAGRQDGLIELWDVDRQKPVAHLAMTSRGRLVVVDAEGRFDAGSLEELDLLHWVRGEEPYRALPLELFMRDYFEPRLLWRLLGREKFPPVRSLDALNLVQPVISIKSVTPEEGAPDRVRIVVEVGRAESEFQRNGKLVKITTGVHDIRILRDGQLVGALPESGGEITVDPVTGKALLTFSNIRLPLGGRGRTVEFSAYAFNDDRIKSATVRTSYELPVSLTSKAIKGRAYVVTIGVNAYENQAWNLAFAVNDSRLMEEGLAARLKNNGDFSDVITVSLRSEHPELGGLGLATKQNLKNVLALLAGRSIDQQALSRIPVAEKLRAVTPDDVVMITFSGHGYADGRGRFYLLLSDTGAGSGQSITESLLQRAVSSDELAEWIRYVDAGALTFIIDACHSAASVEGQGFKPGPMGSRGLGQLAYDKGMRILAASQADDVALESELIKQGLLSYALVNDGLDAKRADFKPKDQKITLEEWLAYAVERVPGLAQEVRAGAVQGADGKRALTSVIRPAAAKPLGVTQQPVLFDFASRRTGMTLQ